ncbi:MAG: hypothetical protein HY902_05720 [Deltaproteobacteria bacterium]|nr:hypothetical protein [Deltaproteobacteria bacterium]
MNQTRKLLAVLLLATTPACGVPIRYAVPAQELVGKQVFSGPVRLVDDGDVETCRILAVDPAENVAPVESTTPEAERVLQASLPKHPGAEAILTTDDVRTWPSVLCAIALGQVGALVGTGVQGSDSSSNNAATTIGMGTAIGVFAGIALGSLLSGRVKSGHFAGVVAPRGVDAPVPPPPAPVPPPRAEPLAPPAPAPIPAPPPAEATPASGGATP